MKEKIMIKFNFITNIFILLTLLFGRVIWADSNGVWTLAKDVRPGIFGSDENANSSNNYTFINDVYFKSKLKHNSTYYIDIADRTQLNDLAVNKISSNEILLNSQNIDSRYIKVEQSCSNNQILKWDGSNWTCADDTNGITSESDPTINGLNCANGQVLKWNNGWDCGNDINTDTQDLSISGHTISLTNGGSVTVPDNNKFPKLYTGSGCGACPYGSTSKQCKIKDHNGNIYSSWHHLRALSTTCEAEYNEARYFAFWSY